LSFDLKAAIAPYEIKRPFEGASKLKVVTSTRRFQLDDNPLGIRSILLRFDASGNCFLTFINASAIHNIPFGLNNWLYGKTDRALSFARMVYPNPMGVTPVQTAGICSWTADNQLTAYYLSMFNTGSDETFRFTFEGDLLKMEIIAPTGPRPGPPNSQQTQLQNLVFTGIKIKN
jgi:hypothetical protein